MDKQSYGYENLISMLKNQVDNQPNKIAYTFLKDGLHTEASSMTFQEVDSKARAVAAHLQERYKQGEKALLLYGQSLEHICVLWACFYAGITAVPLYLPQNERAYKRIESIQLDSDAKIILSDSESRRRIEKSLGKRKELLALDWIISDEIPLISADNWKRPEVSSQTTAYLQYTSGSTGVSKGVLVTHGNLIYNLADMSESWRHDSESLLVSWLPIFHDMGLILGFLQGIYNGFQTVFMSPTAFAQRPLKWLQAVSHYRATHTGGPDSSFMMCVEKIPPEQKSSLDLSTLKFMFNGSEPVRSETLEKFTEAFTECGFKHEMHNPCYGLAEATLKVTASWLNTSPIVCKLDINALEKNRVLITEESNGKTFVSSGTTKLDTEVKIVNPVNLEICPDNAIGEIWIKGPTVANGYYNNLEDTKSIFQAYTSDTKEGPYLRTGDLGFLREDNIFIAGRLKDLIIIRGRNCYPQDIEATVEKSHPSLAPSGGAAFSLESNDEEQLVIVHSLRRTYINKVEPELVFHSIRKAISSEFSVKVHSIQLLMPASVPRTTSGKIQRKACKQAYITKKLNVVASWQV